MTFSLGQNSKNELVGVAPVLVKVVNLGIQLTEQDFVVYDGGRTEAQQREYVRRGTSKTMHSRHLIQPDGLGHAVDLVPWINGKARWEWGAIYPIAEAMREASERLGVRLVWGGVWDRDLGTYGRGAEAMKAGVAEYQKRHPGPDFIDGPHFELAKGQKGK